MNLSTFLGYASIPIISGLIGWITNYLAIRMLFRPYKPIHILGIKFHGLIPQRHFELADSIGETIQSELISHHDLKQILDKPEVKLRITATIAREIERFVEEKLTSNPLIGMFLEGEGGKFAAQVVMGQLKNSIGDIFSSIFDSIEGDLNFKEIVSEKIKGFDLSKFEEIVYKISSNELKTIEILGGVLGFVVGVAQVSLLLLV